VPLFLNSKVRKAMLKRKTKKVKEEEEEAD
jgi:hypothetical protein